MGLRTFSALVLSFSLIACGGSSQPSRDNSELKKPTPIVQSPQKPLLGPENCGSVTLPKRNLLYCFEDRDGQAKVSRSRVSVLYYFHGLGGSITEIFDDSGRFVLDSLQKIFFGRMPIVISISVGPSGVVSDEAPDIVQAGLDQIEARVVPGKEVRRIIMGGSMGGHNALRVLAEKPSRFVAGVGLCPAMGTFNGFNQAEVDAYMERNRTFLDRSFFLKALDIYKKEMPTPEIWVANNPFTLLDQGRYDGVPIFLSVGREDTLGFVEGSREFKRRADLRPGMDVNYREFRGPHCTFDVPAFVEFIFKQVNR